MKTRLDVILAFVRIGLEILQKVHLTGTAGEVVNISEEAETIFEAVRTRLQEEAGKPVDESKVPEISPLP